MPGIPCPPWARSHGRGGAPAHLGSGLAHGSMQSAAGGGGPGGSALAGSATIRPSPQSRANTAATMKVPMVAPRSRFRPARCRGRPGSSRGRTRRSWRRRRRRVWRWQTRDCGKGSGPVSASTGALSVSNKAVAAMARAAVTAMWANTSLLVPPVPRSRVRSARRRDTCPQVTRYSTATVRDNPRIVG
jgi:hypothetical protein